MTRYYFYPETGQIYALFDEGIYPPLGYEDITNTWDLGSEMLNLLYGISQKTYRYIGYMEFLGRDFANVMRDGRVVQPARRGRGRPQRM